VTTYVAGRMRGVEDLNRSAFAVAADRLRAQGHAVYNPAAANLEGMPLPRIMAQVLTQLCECDTIALLPRWWMSGGARVEWLLARYLRLRIVYL
jgi:putative NADPH-quinone reductase